MENQNDPRFTPADARIIKAKARRIVGQLGFRSSDVEDIEQELATHFFQQAERYDPARGTRAQFVSTVIQRKLLNLADARTAQKRDDRRNIAYDDASEGAMIDDATNESQIDLKLDVQSFAASLPTELRAVFALMLQQFNGADIAELLHLSRQQCRTLIQKVQQKIRAAHLDEYVTATKAGGKFGK